MRYRQPRRRRRSGQLAKAFIINKRSNRKTIKFNQEALFFIKIGAFGFASYFIFLIVFRSSAILAATLPFMFTVIIVLIGAAILRSLIKNIR
jgi:hypothetical protein